ncbi:hypothetical protein [Sorangium sp. So ce341]|uniref:hypothetical protein n=1 Tax=Sorangium sp. So ce341 TaxID=3133302 RepID=UPI003F6264B5
MLRAPTYGNLSVSSETVTAHHARRARFHGAWALVLGAALAALHLGLFRALYASVLRDLGLAGGIGIDPAGGIGVGPAALALFIVGAAARLTSALLLFAGIVLLPGIALLVVRLPEWRRRAARRRGASG